MIEKFFMWWLEEHYIWSTILTPAMTTLWCIFKDDFLPRGVVACIIWLLASGNSQR